MKDLVSCKEQASAARAPELSLMGQSGAGRRRHPLADASCQPYESNPKKGAQTTAARP